MKKFLILLIILLLSVTLFAEITINGDARVRPRLDQKFNKDGKYSEDFYYMYWARLWLDAKLTDGWYFSTKIASDGPGNFIGRFGDTPYDGNGGWTDAAAAHSGSRGVLRFAEMHFGRKNNQMGFSMGILPMSGLGNPEYDLHFYPVSNSDIPYTIVNSASAAGVRGYYKFGEGKLNLTLTLDNNTGNRENDANPRDPYSLFANYEMKFGDIDVAPAVILTSADEDEAAPITGGVNVGLPKIAGFNFSGGLYYTNQSINDTTSNFTTINGKYSGFMSHLKAVRSIGPGTLVSWLDFKSVTPNNEADDVNTTLLWVMYKYVVYKSEVGSFYIAPTFRRIMQNSGNMEYARNKIELTMQLNFK